MRTASVSGWSGPKSLDHPVGHGGGPAVDIVPFLGTFIEQSLGENDFPLGRLAVRQVDFALENGDDGLVVVVLDLLDRPPRGVGRLGGDDTHLFERGAWSPGPRKDQVVDVPAGPVGHEGDELLRWVASPDPVGHDPGEFAEVVSRCHSYRASVFLLHLGDAPDIVESIVGDEGERLVAVGPDVYYAKFGIAPGLPA